MPEPSAHEYLQVLDRLSTVDIDAVGVVPVAETAGSRLHDQVVKLLPEARSIVVLAGELFTEIVDHSAPFKEMGAASPRDMLPPHMDYVNGRLTRSAYDLSKAIRRQGLKALPLPAAGTPGDQRYLFSVLSFKHAAEAAGLGSMGWHSLLITPRFGPRVRLACVLTEADLPSSGKEENNLCAECGKCLNACPSHALSEPKNGETYSINKFACGAFRGASGACSECMRVCPVGR